MIKGVWNRERELLRRVMEAGGYFTKRQLSNLSEITGLGSSIPVIRERLMRWVKRGWVQSVRLEVDPGIEVFKLGFRGLCLLVNKDSYIRRSHDWTVVMRRLRRLDFMCEYLKRGFELALVDRKKWEFIERTGFTVDVLPKLPRGRGKIRSCSEILGMNGDGKLYIFHLDQEGTRVSVNFHKMLDDFKTAIASGAQCLKFKVIVFEKSREWKYHELLLRRRRELKEDMTTVDVEGL